MNASIFALSPPWVALLHAVMSVSEQLFAAEKRSPALQNTGIDQAGTRSSGPRIQEPSRMSDPLSFDDIYCTYFSQVYRWVRALGAAESELDDLTQEVFLVVNAKLANFDGQHLRAWLHKIAQNVVSDHKRRAWFRRRSNQSDETLDTLPTDTEPGREAERREAWRLVERALGGLSMLQREAFMLFELEGYTGEEIAELQQVPLNTVYTRLHHARRRFLEEVARSRTEETKS